MKQDSEDKLAHVLEALENPSSFTHCFHKIPPVLFMAKATCFHVNLKRLADAMPNCLLSGSLCRSNLCLYYLPNSVSSFTICFWYSVACSFKAFSSFAASSSLI